MVRKEARGHVPVFVKIDDYKDVLDILNLAREKLNIAKNTLVRIKELKEKEAKEIEVWESELAGVEEKLNGVDSTLLEPETP